MDWLVELVLFIAPAEFRDYYGTALLNDYREAVESERRARRSPALYTMRVCVNLFWMIFTERTTVMLRELSYTYRSLFRTPLTTVVMIVTLALGIGANVGAFSIVNGVLLHQLPYDHPERVVNVWRTTWINDFHCVDCPHSS